MAHRTMGWRAMGRIELVNNGGSYTLTTLFSFNGTDGS